MPFCGFARSFAPWELLGRIDRILSNNYDLFNEAKNSENCIWCTCPIAQILERCHKSVLSCTSDSETSVYARSACGVDFTSFLASSWFGALRAVCSVISSRRFVIPVNIIRLAITIATLSNCVPIRTFSVPFLKLNFLIMVILLLLSITSN